MGTRQTPQAPRIEAFDRLLGNVTSREHVEKNIVGFHSHMRLALGSGAEPRVPFALASDVSRAIAAAVAELGGYVFDRLEPASANDLPKGERLRDPYFGLRSFKDGSVERKMAQAMVGAEPLLDAAIAEAFSRGAGGALFAILTRVYSAALDEEVSTAGAEPSSFLAHLAIVNAARAFKDTLKSTGLKGLGYETLERAVGVGLSAVVSAAIDDACARHAAKGLAVDLSMSHAILVAAGSPLAFIAIGGSALRSSPNAWALSKELADSFDTLGLHPVHPGRPLAETIGEAARRVAKSKEARVLAWDHGALTSLRASVLRYLRDYDVGKEPRHEAFVACVTGVHTLSAALGRIRVYEAAWHGAASLKNDVGGTQRAALEELERLFAELAKRKGPIDSDVATAESAAAWVLWRLDGWFESKAAIAREALVDRALEYGIKELRARYDAGKVYRIGADGAPFLVEQKTRAEEAHLFLDLKGFTRMVATAKEASAVEFMKHRFYVPILEKARAYREVGRRIELNNLLGDAVSFSGDVEALVLLAEDVNTIFIEYEDSLRSRGVRAGRIEAGLFIAFGAVAESVHIDSSGWGDAGFLEEVGVDHAQRIKVAIAEKINESARGTARNGAVWARMQALLADDAKLRNDDPRELPWNVYVDRILQLTLPPTTMELCERALEAGDRDFAKSAAAAVAELLEKALVAGEGDKSKPLATTSDVYNVGRALSREALDAFLSQTKTRRKTVEMTIPIAELPAAFKKYLFPEKEIRLVISWDTGKVPRPPVVFRYAGEIAFRGFEGIRSTAIYEILDSSAPVYSLLDRNYLSQGR